MAERALAEVYSELRHYATVKGDVACGQQDADLVTTCRQHVTCRECLAALGPAGPYAPPRPTLGDLALKELAELRGRIKALADDCQRRGDDADLSAWSVAEALRGLLDGEPRE